MSQEPLEYPYPLNLRWNYLEFFPVFYRRYRNSRFGLLADWDVQGAAFALMAVSMEMNPPATLPNDHFLLASYLRMPQEKWHELMQRDITPLDGWVDIRCGDKVLLTHSLLLKGLEIAVKEAKLRQRGTKDRRRGDPPDAGRAPR